MYLYKLSPLRLKLSRNFNYSKIKMNIYNSAIARSSHEEATQRNSIESLSILLYEYTQSHMSITVGSRCTCAYASFIFIHLYIETGRGSVLKASIEIVVPLLLKFITVACNTTRIRPCMYPELVDSTRTFSNRYKIYINHDTNTTLLLNLTYLCPYQHQKEVC